MKYKNIVFDFGNVLVRFDPDRLVRTYCPEDNDFKIVRDKLFYDWDLLDSGRIEYEQYMDNVENMLPKHLIPAFRQIRNEWYMHMDPIRQTWSLINDLKEKGYRLYVLSNAPTFFAEHASYFNIVNKFDEMVFSGPIKLAKPEPEIYKYLFDKYDLDPEECLFIDDKEININAAKELGMDGVVFTPDKVELLREILL